MKRLLSFVLCVILLFTSSLFPVFAHPSRTDSNDGHWNHSTGEYHYHGEPDSNSSSGSNSGNTANRDWGNSDHSGGSGSSSSSSNTGEIVGIIIACVVFGPFLLICVFVPIFEKLKELFTKKEDPTPIQKEAPSPEPPLQKSQPPRERSAPSTKSKPPTPPRTQTDVFTAPLPSVETEPCVDVSCNPTSKQAPAPRPRIRGSEEHLPPPLPPAVKPKTNTSAPRTSPPRPQPPTAHKPLEQYPDVLDVNFDYLTRSQAQAYAASIDSPRGKRAVTEFYHFDEPIVDKSQKPYRVECGMFSASSLNYYETSLTSCSCPDHRARHQICKHMIALAIKIDAITVDIEKVKKRE